MKYKLNIYCNKKIQNFLTKSLFQYEIIFIDLGEFGKSLNNSEANVIIINNAKDADLIDFNIVNNNCLIISILKNINFRLSDDIKLFNTPLTINHFKSIIENFVQNIKVKFHDIRIDNEKLTNINNKSFCYLTKVELEILSYLIREKETSKKFIKKNVLNIKTNIETNSLESHLTRIRKKMTKIQTEVRIQTKNEKLLITY